ncbi:ankyrin repeat domain-containing protein 6-like isoform X1 [Rhipicephalus sanguineus]|uniref:ankyrin repeat domain-containing protein 6-like isoform X1 n=1 Tax=Rhipicephalus sanguineus TaxID=34632 RepID=UPI0018931A00|nr:ankyrin repeat domain-containing protein 6-like isoform X1 [Rhipicephalus sanguineus]
MAGPDHVPTLADRLYQAAVAGQTETVVELCRIGARIEADPEGRTALHMAAANGYVDTARALILAGAKVNALDACGYSPLHQAATEGHEEVVRLLVKHNCLVDVQDEMHGNTALHEAAWKGYSRTIEVLCKNKANVYIKNKGGFSPLHLACQNGHNQSTRVLLLAGCKPDIKNNYGDTPLHTASRYGHAGVLRILISAFCNASEVNKNGDSGLHITAAMGRRKLTRILLEAGCDPTIVNKQGETALDIARRKEFNEVADLIEHPPPQVIQLDSSSSPLEQQRPGEGGKKREKESGTSQGSKDSSHNKGRTKDKHKKSKHGHKVHFDDEKKDKKGKLSPYGCHQTPNLSSFPAPKLETLPAEPLSKGEQYFLDLAGNIRKGPVGKGYTCYCAPFFHNVEKKLEADKQELIDHIDHAHEDLNAKIAHLERKTRNQLFNLNQSVREKLAAEKTECQERVERAALRERLERERRQETQHAELRSELQSYVRERVAQVDYRCTPLGQSSDCKNRFSEVPLHWSRRNRLNGFYGNGVARAKSEEVLRDLNGADGIDEEELAAVNNDRVVNGRLPQVPAPSGLFGNEVGLPPPPAHLANRVGCGGRPDFEKLGAKPKYPLWDHNGEERTSPSALLVHQQQPSPIAECRGEHGIRRSPADQASSPGAVRHFKSHGDLTATYKKEDFQDEEKEKEEVSSPNHSPSPPVTTNGTCGEGLRPSPSPAGNGDLSPTAHTTAQAATSSTTTTTPPPTHPKPAKPPLMPRPTHPPPYSSHVHRFSAAPSSQARPLRVSYGPSPSELAAADALSGYYNGGAAYANANGGAVEDQLCKLNEGLSLDPESGCPSSEV